MANQLQSKNKGVKTANVNNLAALLRLPGTPCQSITHSYIEHTRHGVIHHIITTKIDRN